MRKLLLVLLAGSLCLGLVGTTIALAYKANYYDLKEYEELTGKKLEFKEPPVLRTQVASGKLPPVTERLPEEPCVVKPLEEIGQYGGALRVGTPSLTSGVDSAHTRNGGVWVAWNHGTHNWGKGNEVYRNNILPGDS